MNLKHVHNNVKSYQRLLTLFIFSIWYSQAQASGIAGGSITYRYLGNHKYLIIAQLLRTFNSDSMPTPEFGVYCGDNGSNQCGSHKIYTFKRTRINKLGSTCTSVVKTCYITNNKSNCRGIEEQIFTDTINLNSNPFLSYLNSACSEITFYVRINSRVKATTHADTSGMALKATLNFKNLSRCNKTFNSGAIWQNYGNQFLCCNNSTYLVFGSVNNIDKDSIKYKLTPALSDVPNTAVSYNLPFSYQYPVTPYCVPPGNIKCTRNIKTTPSRGFYFDTTDGTAIYTPTLCSEISTIAFEAIEYRRDSSGNLVEIGRFTREITNFINDSCGYNKAPELSASFVNSVCAGEKICISIYGKDETFTPYQSIPDTVKIYRLDSNDGTSLSTINPKDREKQAQLCWQTSLSDASEFPYKFTLIATDQHCPSPSISAAVISIKVNYSFTEKPKINIKSIKCGIVKTQIAKKSPATSTYHWTLSDSNGVFFTQQGDSFTSNYLMPGNYKLKLTQRNQNYCSADTTINFTIAPHPLIDIGLDTSICQNQNFSFKPNIKSTIRLFNPRWYFLGNPQILDTNLTLHLKAPLNNNFLKFNMQDSTGCLWPGINSNNLGQTKYLEIITVPSLHLGNDTTICFGDSILLQADSLPNSKIIWNTASKMFKIWIKKESQYSASITYSTGCISNDTITVNFLKPSQFISINSRNFCYSNSPDSIDLRQLVLDNGFPINKWEINFKTAAFNQDYQSTEIPKIKIHSFYFPKNSTTGNWLLSYKISNTGCSITDTVNLNIKPKPIANFTTNPSVAYNTGNFMTINSSYISDNTPLKFWWNFGRGNADTSVAKEPFILYGNSISDYTIHLKANSIYGCNDTFSKKVQVIANNFYLLPEAYKLNNLLIAVGPNIKSSHLILKDAIGKVVFESDYNTGIKSQDLKPGIYYYELLLVLNNGNLIPASGKTVISSH